MACFRADQTYCGSVVGGISRRTFLATSASVATVAGLAACSTSASLTGQGSAAEAETAASGVQPTHNWWITNRRRADPSLVEAYTGKASITSGEQLPLHVSTSADQFNIEVYRIGHYDGQGGALIAKAGPFTGRSQNKAMESDGSRMTAARWQSSAVLDTSDWTEGLHLIHVIVGKKRTEAPVLVRSDSTDGKVALIAAPMTWQAYNTWGGRSLYRSENGSFAERSFAVSLDRPMAPTGRTVFYAFEVPIFQQAEAADVPLAYTTNIDISSNGSTLAGAKGAVSTGHDEYWTVDYRNALEKARDAGTNIAFLGANAGYWRVRLQDSDTGPDRTVACYKSAALDPMTGPSTTARFRDSPDSRPEAAITGQLYDAFPANGDMTIRDPDFFLFDGTDVSEGQKISRLLGPETDRYYPISASPDRLQIPALSPVTCNGKATWSTMTYYTADSGAGVVATGTMGWTRAMPRPINAGFPQQTTEFVSHVTNNLLQAMASGPMGNDHPVRDDTGDVKLPSTSTTGAS